MTASAETTPPRNILLSSATSEGAAPVREAADRHCRQAIRKALLAGAGLSAGLIVPNRQDGPLEALIPKAQEGGIVFLVEHEGQACGLISLSYELCVSITEAQTLGGPGTDPAPERDITSVDEIFARPVALVVLASLTEDSTPLASWAGGAEMGERIETLALGGLVLPGGRYRMLRLEVDLGEARSGEVALVLPHEGVLEATAREARRQGKDEKSAREWSAALERNVLEARIELTAVLHKMPATLREVQEMSVGQILYLKNASLEGVSVCTGKGHVLSQGCLGKIGGARALRIGEEGPKVLEVSGPDLLLPQREASASRRGVIPPMS